jgi:hypothetical protein
VTALDDLAHVQMTVQPISPHVDEIDGPSQRGGLFRLHHQADTLTHHHKSLTHAAVGASSAISEWSSILRVEKPRNTVFSTTR